MVLGPYAEVVHVLAGDALDLSQVLGGLAHRQVDVRKESVPPRVVPGHATLGGLDGSLLRPGEYRVVRARPGVGVPMNKPRHGFDAGRDKAVAFARTDRMAH